MKNCLFAVMLCVLSVQTSFAGACKGCGPSIERGCSVLKSYANKGLCMRQGVSAGIALGCANYTRSIETERLCLVHRLSAEQAAMCTFYYSNSEFAVAECLRACAGG